MSKLILIKHARPQVIPDIPSHDWPLSEEGRSACGALAEKVRVFSPRTIITSDEPKAAQTGELLADALGVSVNCDPDLHEHDRSNVPHMQTREFISYMALFFQKPGEQVLGTESADEALERFETAIDRACDAKGDDNIAIVSHGTVIALYLAHLNAGDAFTLWRRMGLPSFAVIDTSSRKVIETIDRVE